MILGKKKFKDFFVIFTVSILMTVFVSGKVHSRPEIKTSGYSYELSNLIKKAKLDLRDSSKILKEESRALAGEYKKSEKIKKNRTKYWALLNKAKENNLKNKKLKRPIIDHSSIYKIEYDYYNSLYKMSQRSIALQLKKVDVAKQVVKSNNLRLNQLLVKSFKFNNFWCPTGTCCPPNPLSWCTDWEFSDALR